MCQEEITIKIFKKHRRTWQKWCKIKSKKSAELMAELMEAAQNKIRFAEYLKSLTLIDNYTPPLIGCKIDKSRVCIQKKVRN